jgi:hypothetical protein
MQDNNIDEKGESSYDFNQNEKKVPMKKNLTESPVF